MKKLVYAALIAPILLTGCSSISGIFSEKEKEKLPGERVSILELQRDLEPDSDALNAQGFVAPAPWRNEFWPQAGGYPNHAMANIDLNTGPLKKIWDTKIGEGASDDVPLIAQPVLVDGKIYALDTDSKLSSFAAKDGKKLWTTKVGDPKEKDSAIGGGVSYSRGQLYVTNGYNEILAVAPDTGKILWRARIPTPSRAAPTIVEDRVFVVTMDNRLLALSARDGSSLWQYTGITESTGLVGAASPAASRDIVVPAFSSGEVAALRIENGTVAWTENLAAINALGGLTGLSDIRGLPVIDKDLVIAISFGGRLVAIDSRTGTRVWQREIGSAQTPWVVGNHIFVTSTEGELVALGRDDGAIRWVYKLPRFTGKNNSGDAIEWTGPILAGGRLIVASTNGDVAEVTPEDGKLVRSWSVKNSVSITPFAAGGTLYILRDDGVLSAYQ